MEIVATYRGRHVTASDIAVFKEILAAYPEGSRRFISREVCPDAAKNICISHKMPCFHGVKPLN